MTAFFESSACEIFIFHLQKRVTPTGVSINYYIQEENKYGIR